MTSKKQQINAEIGQSNSLANWSITGIIIPVVGWICGGKALSIINRFNPDTPTETIQFQNIKTKAWVGIILSTLSLLGGLWLRWHISQPSTYTKSYELNFTNSCIDKGATASYCSCALKYVEDHYTFEQASQMERAGSYDNNTLSAITEKCS